MERMMPKRMIMWFAALVVALLAVPGVAFANPLESATMPQEDVSADTAPWTSWADGDVIFTVKYMTKAEGPATVKEFTKADMVELAKVNDEPQSYAFSGKNGVEVVVATQYVTLDQLLNELGIDPSDAGDYITISDEAAEKPFTSADYYESISSSARYFFPNFSSEDMTNTADMVATPAIIALEWGSAKNVQTTAGEAYQAALSASHHGQLRNLWGKTADDLKNGNAGGRPYVTGAASLTYEQRPFSLYTRTGAGEKTLVKKYLLGDLEELATDASENGQGYLMASGSDWSAFATTQYVTYEKLFENAGITASKDNVFVAAASDGFSSTLTYDQLEQDVNFYGGTTKANNDESYGAIEAKAALALNYAQVTTMEGDVTAFQAVQAAAQGELKTQYRTFIGVSKEHYDARDARGNRFATGPVELSVVTVKDIASDDVAVDGVKPAYDFTGEAIEPAVTVSDGSATLSVVNKKGVGDYAISYEANRNAGTGKVVIEGKNSYKGKKEVEFAINAADLSNAKVELANTSAVYTGATQQGAVKSVVLNGVSLVEGTDYEVSAASGKNAGSYAVTVKGKDNCTGSVLATFTITKANQTVVAKNKNAGKLKAKKLKKKVQTIKAAKVVKGNSAKTALTYKLKKANKSKGKFKVAADGMITVKKKLKKGTYKLTITASAAADANYNAASKDFVVTIKVK